MTLADMARVLRVVNDPHPRRLVDDKAVRGGKDAIALCRVEGLLRLDQEVVDPTVAEMAPVPVGRREAVGVVIAIK